MVRVVMRFIRVHLFTTKITLTHYNHIWYCRVPGHLLHTDGSLRSLPPTAPAPRSPTPPPQVISPTTERARRKEQAFSHLLSELSPISDTTVVPSIIELQGRFPGLGKVWLLQYMKGSDTRSVRAFMSRWQIRLFRV